MVGTADLTRKKNPTRSCGCAHLRPLVPPPATTAAAPLVPATPERTTTAQQALNRFHDEHSPPGRVRRAGPLTKMTRPGA